MTRLFSFLYIAACHTVHVRHFSCVLLVVRYIYIKHLIFDILSINIENVGECCHKVQCDRIREERYIGLKVIF